MATLSDHKGLDVVEDATGDGGIALTGNLKELIEISIEIYFHPPSELGLH